MEDTTAAGMSVGVVGLGMIGGGIAEHVAAAGLPLTVFDVRPDAADALDGVDAVVASPAEVATASDVVVIAVMSADQAREVLVGDRGLLTAGRSGLIVVLVSTVSIPDFRELAALAGEGAATLLDAGVTQAGDGLLVTMIGGPEDLVERVRPVLGTFSRAVFHCGPLGAGMITKIAKNLVTYACWGVVHEAASLARAGGVDPADLVEIIHSASGFAGGTEPVFMLDRVLNDAATAERRAPQTEVMANKDLAAAQDAGRQLSIGTPIADIVRPQVSEILRGRFNEGEIVISDGHAESLSPSNSSIAAV